MGNPHPIKAHRLPEPNPRPRASPALSGAGADTPRPIRRPANTPSRPAAVRAAAGRQDTGISNHSGRRKAVKPSTIKPVSVLVVDDSAIIRSRLRALLAEDDHICCVGEAESRAEAWTLFQQLRPEVVLLDLCLPDGNGLALLCRIKQAAPSCLVIVLTNSCEPIFRQESQRCGADHFLHKSTEFDRVTPLLLNLPARSQPQPREQETAAAPRCESTVADLGL
jgi:CheY-like chemotaxis protein